MNIIAGLWYLCHQSHDYFTEGYWHFSPMDGYLVGSDNKPHPVSKSWLKDFTGGDLIRIKTK